MTSDPPDVDRESALWRWIGAALLLALGLACVANIIRVTSLVLSDPNLLNYTEGISLLAGDRLLAGQPLYPDVNQPPYVYLAYPPVYPAVCAATLAVFGKSLLALRGLTLVLEVGVGALVYALLRQEGLGRLRAAFFGVLVLGLYSVNKFHGLARVDTLVLTEVLGALWLLRDHEGRGRRWSLVAAAITLVLACLTKPTAAVLFVAMGAWYLVAWRRGSAAARRILLACVGAASVYGALVGVLHLATDGQFLLHTVVYQGASGRNPHWQTAGPFMRLFRVYGLLLFAPLAALLLRRRPSLLGVLAWTSLAWLFVSSFKAGADLNYTLEPIALLVLVLGSTFGRHRPGLTWLPEPWAWQAQRAAVLGAVLLVTAGVYVRSVREAGGRGAYLERILAPGPRATRRAISRFVAGSPGLTLCEEPFYAVRHGKPFWLSDPFQLAVLAKQGRFRFDPVLAALRSGRIRRAVIGPRLARVPGLWPLLVKHYRYRGGGPAMDEGTPLQMWQWAPGPRVAPAGSVLPPGR